MTWLETLANVLEAITLPAVGAGMVSWGLVQVFGLFCTFYLYSPAARDPEAPPLWLRIVAPFIWVAGTLAFVTTALYVTATFK